MKKAILSDIHGNLEALRAVLHDISERGIEEIIFLGDVVGYGADPEACLTLIDEHASVFVVGNHDLAAATGEGDETFHPDAKASIGWTKIVLSPQDKKKLMQFPLLQESDQMHFSHGSPENITIWKYILTESDAKKGFAACPQKLIFVGHSHTPAIFVELEHKRMFGGEFRQVTRIIQPFIRIENDYRYIFDVGSVGQPRDGDPRACYGYYDSEQRRFELVRVTYDVDRAADKITKSGLPLNLSERLKKGR